MKRIGILLAAVVLLVLTVWVVVDGSRETAAVQNLRLPDRSRIRSAAGGPDASSDRRAAKTTTMPPEKKGPDSVAKAGGGPPPALPGTPETPEEPIPSTGRPGPLKTAGGPVSYDVPVGDNGEFPEFWKDPGVDEIPDGEKTDLLNVAVTRDAVTLTHEIIKRLPWSERPPEDAAEGVPTFAYKLLDVQGQPLHEGRFPVPSLCEQCPPGQPDHVRSEGSGGEGIQPGGVVFQHRVDMLLKLPYHKAGVRVAFFRHDRTFNRDVPAGEIRLHRE